MSIKLKGSTAGSVALDAPANTNPSGSDIELTLPIDAGSANQFLKNGSTAGELEYSSMVEDSSGRLLVGLSSGSGDPVAAFQGRGGDATDSGVVAISRTGTNPSGSIGELRFTSGSDLNKYYAYILCQSDATTSSTSLPGRIIFGTTASGATSPTERMRITHEGYMRFGQSTSDSPGYGNTTTGISMLSDGRIFSSMGGTFSQFNRNSDGSVLSFARSSTGVGQISVSSSSTSYGTSSDYRLKENVVALDGAIARLKQLLPKRFNFIVDADTTVDGFLAHEAQTVVPEAVTGTHDEVDDDNNPVYQGIDQSKLVPLLTAALQEAIGKIETLETKVAALEAA